MFPPLKGTRMRKSNCFSRTFAPGHHSPFSLFAFRLLQGTPSTCTLGFGLANPRRTDCSQHQEGDSSCSTFYACRHERGRSCHKRFVITLLIAAQLKFLSLRDHCPIHVQNCQCARCTSPKPASAAKQSRSEQRGRTARTLTNCLRWQSGEDGDRRVGGELHVVSATSLFSGKNLSLDGTL